MRARVAAEDEAPGIRKEPENLEQQNGASGFGNGPPSPKSRRWGADDPRERATGKDERDDLATRDRRPDGHDEESSPE